MARLMSRKTIASLVRRPVVAWLVAGVARTLGATLRYETPAARAIPELLAAERGAIFVIWHRELLLGLGHAFPIGAGILVSAGRDGETAARILRYLGLRSIRGSSSRGGERALLEMVSAAETRRTGSFIIAPDGPRGPAGVAKTGAVYLASRTGLPLVPVRFEAARTWQLRTWDRMLIPKPFTRVRVRFGAETVVPRGLDRAGLGEWLAQLEHAMAATAGARAPATETAAAEPQPGSP